MTDHNPVPAPADLDALYNILLCTFQEGISAEEYRLVLAVLHAFMPYDILADMLSALTGRDYNVVYEEVAGFAYGVFPAYEDIDYIIQRMDACGYDEWLQSQTSG